MKYMLFLSFAIITRLAAMENAKWDLEKMATRIGNQRRADDKDIIKKFQAIAKKSYKDLTHEEKTQLTDLAWRHEHSCILELLCQSPLFKEKGMGLQKDRMLYFTVQEVTAGMHNTLRRARVLKNVEALLKCGAGQDEERFKSVIGDYYIFNTCGITAKDFQVRHITQEDHLALIGLFAKHVKHAGFKVALENELRSNKNREWALKVAKVAIENGMDQSLLNVASHNAAV